MPKAKALFEQLLAQSTGVERPLLLIGGCARSGKSTLAGALQQAAHEHIPSVTVIPLDWWIVPASQRPHDSTVLQRYEIPRLLPDIQSLLAGEPIFPPIYDPISRERLTEQRPDAVYAPPGWVIVEGVLALGLPSLRQQAVAGIYVSVPDSVRQQRLCDFYVQDKGFSEQQARDLIRQREAEEVLWVKATAAYARYQYGPNTK